MRHRGRDDRIVFDEVGVEARVQQVGGAEGRAVRAGGKRQGTQLQRVLNRLVRLGSPSRRGPARGSIARVVERADLNLVHDPVDQFVERFARFTRVAHFNPGSSQVSRLAQVRVSDPVAQSRPRSARGQIPRNLQLTRERVPHNQIRRHPHQSPTRRLRHQQQSTRQQQRHQGSKRPVPSRPRLSCTFLRHQNVIRL